jgi:hypothetical protein
MQGRPRASGGVGNLGRSVSRCVRRIDVKALDSELRAKKPALKHRLHIMSKQLGR